MPLWEPRCRNCSRAVVPRQRGGTSPAGRQRRLRCRAEHTRVALVLCQGKLKRGRMRLAVTWARAHSKWREEPALPQDLPVSMGLEGGEARLKLPVPKASCTTPCCDALGLPTHWDAWVRANVTAPTCLQTLADVALFQMFRKGRCWYNHYIAWWAQVSWHYSSLGLKHTYIFL